jgi:hypothetical protein
MGSALSRTVAKSMARQIEGSLLAAMLVQPARWNIRVLKNECKRVHVLTLCP